MYENAPKTKLVILGDSSVGKSCILNRLKFNFFNDNIESTVGCEFFAKEMEVNNQKLKLLIWDTAGQEVFRAFTQNFLRCAKIAIIVYSVNCQQSVLNIESWIKEAQKIENILIVIVGNKSDLENKIDNNYLNRYKSIKNVYIYGVVSAKNNENIQKLFTYTCELYLTKYQNIKKDSIDDITTVNVVDRPEYKKSKCCNN